MTFYGRILAKNVEKPMYDMYVHPAVDNPEEVLTVDEDGVNAI